MKARTFALKERHNLELERFRGIDAATSPFDVASNRAVYMRNWICEDGINQKRHGWDEKFIFQGNMGGPVNGIFQWDESTLIVYVGTRFYRVDMETWSVKDITPEGAMYKSQRCQAFYNQGKMYIIGCGEFLVYGSWNDGETYELRRVSDVAYIPTTTINIDRTDMKSDERGTLDCVNVLTAKRKNTLVGFSGTSGTTTFSWELDSSFDLSFEETGMPCADITIEMETREEVQAGPHLVDVTVKYLIEVGDGELGSDNHYTRVLKKNKRWFLQKIVLTDQESSFYIETLTEPKEDTSYEGEVCGSIDFGEQVIDENGKIEYRGERRYIRLHGNTKPLLEGEPNITVTFNHTTEGYAERINNCSFGVVFGADGYSDRLFLSGNSDFPNIDFYSEQNVFSYFPDQYTVAVGSDATPVVGYGRLSDETLAVYKASGKHEPTIYYRTGRLVQESDGISYVAKFTTLPGNIGEAAVSAHSCLNFAGDPVMLSRNGVYGIVLAENIATQTRYAKTRSPSISNMLAEHNLEDAVMVEYKNRLYLAVDDVCYVADARYKYTPSESVDGAFAYEWWCWDHIPANVWAVVGDALYFGTKYGTICKFDDAYTDRSYFYCNPGDVATNIADSKFTFNMSMHFPLEENVQAVFDSKLVAEVLPAVQAKGSVIAFAREHSPRIHNGMKVCVCGDDWDEVREMGLDPSQDYTIDTIDRGSCTCVLRDWNGDVVVDTPKQFRIGKYLNGQNVFVTNVDPENGTFKIKESVNGDPCKLCAPHMELDDVLEWLPKVRFIRTRNVVAEWVTPYFDMGTNQYEKTILKLTVATESVQGGQLSVGYETRKHKAQIAVKGVKQFSFEDFSFENFSFETGFPTSYTTKKNVRNFNYIRFRFLSENNRNCAVNSVVVTYKINRVSKGVK